MSDTIIAISTYGAQRVKDPATQKTVSAHKIGYTSAAAHLLLALYGTRAQNVSPRQASYIYVQIDDEVVVRHGYILLTLTSEEIERAEATARRFHRAAAYLWREGVWRELPNNRTAEYAPVSPRSGPDFDPTGFRPPSPSTGERETAVSGIIAERSHRSASEKPWWWLSGETYPHRELLKRFGARFSSRRKQWYFIGAELPAAIRALVTSETQSDSEASDEEPESPLLAIFGGRIIGKERGSSGDVIVKGENGVFATRTLWINREEQREPVWEFDLPPQERMGNPLPAAQKTMQTSGALYSLYTRKWHFDQPNKVAALDALVESVPFTDDEPCTVDEVAAILGMQIKFAPIVEPPPRLFALHDTVYARHELETADGKPIPTGTHGKVLRLYHHNAKHGWSYDVDFENIGVCWSFERELTPHEPIPGIKIVRGAIVPPGAILPPTDAEIKRTMLEYGQQPPAEEIVTENEDEPVSPLTEEQQPAIRILKPAPIPADGEPLDAVQTAIRSVKVQPIAAVQGAALTNGRTARIDQAYVGELTGSITGQVFCYGFSVHEGICIYVNMAGPRMGAEAIRAKLSKGDAVTVVPPDAPAIELTAGEGNSGMYHPYLHYLPEARFASLILVHEWAVTPNYGGKATTFIFRTSEAQAVAKLKHHVMQLVNIPVFDNWSAYLYEAGQRAMLVRKTRSAGGIDLLSVNLDGDAWTRLITGGLQTDAIKLS